MYDRISRSTPVNSFAKQPSLLPVNHKKIIGYRQTCGTYKVAATTVIAAIFYYACTSSHFYRLVHWRAAAAVVMAMISDARKYQPSR